MGTVVPDLDAPSPCNTGTCCQGAPGSSGSPGNNGNNGSPGRDGSPGMPGRDGLPGRDGYPGNPGSKGERGDQGLPGPSGSVGPSGPRGSSGERGDSGLRGLPGKVGPAGISGIPGLNGTDGRDGARGRDGLKGQKGMSGSKGEPGSSESRRSAFTVIRTRDQIASASHEVLDFTAVQTNVGNHFDIDTDRFTCQIPGVYLFIYSVYIDYGDISSSAGVDLAVVKDGNIITGSRSEIGGVQIGSSATLHLDVGNNVWVHFDDPGEQINCGKVSFKACQFTGVLLYED